MKIRILVAVLMMGLAFGANAQGTLYGLSNDNKIFITTAMSAATPVGGPYTVSRITPGQVLVGIADQPAGNLIYALGYDPAAQVAELYTISGSGSIYWAVPVSGVLNSLNLGGTGNVTIDINRTLDNQLKIIDRDGNIYRIDVRTGSLTGSGTNALWSGNDLRTGLGFTDAVAYTDSSYGRKAVRETTYGYPATTLDDLLIYPNPVISNTKIALGQPSVGDVNVQVVDMNGSILKRFYFGPGNQLLDIDLTNMPPGIYSVRVSGKGMAEHLLKVVKS